MLSILLRYGDRMLLRSAPSCQLRDAGGWRVGVEASGSVPNYIHVRVVHLPYGRMIHGSRHDGMCMHTCVRLDRGCSEGAAGPLSRALSLGVRVTRGHRFLARLDTVRLVGRYRLQLARHLLRLWTVASKQVRYGRVDCRKARISRPIKRQPCIVRQLLSTYLLDSLPH